MKAILGCTLVASMALAAGGSPNRQLVGAWHLAWLEQPGPDGKLHRITDAKGSLIYTPDGRMSVQVMFASTDGASNEYAQGGYEGSFGTYEVDASSHTVTHHVQGANVRALVGKALPRVYDLSNGRLLIKSARPDEHWSVAWEHE
jgi:hypothetical protein